jgi:hypothetical protein
VHNKFDVVTQVDNAQLLGRAIQFCEESPDNEHPEIKWQIFGLVDTNEVAVIAKCGEFKIGISEQSWLLHPSMADRIFGIDEADLQLSHKLTHDLWAANSSHLVELATVIRSRKGQK